MAQQCRGIPFDGRQRTTELMADGREKFRDLFFIKSNLRFYAGSRSGPFVVTKRLHYYRMEWEKTKAPNVFFSSQSRHRLRTGKRLMSPCKMSVHQILLTGVFS